METPIVVDFTARSSNSDVVSMLHRRAPDRRDTSRVCAAPVRCTATPFVHRDAKPGNMTPTKAGVETEVSRARERGLVLGRGVVCPARFERATFSSGEDPSEKSVTPDHGSE